MKFSLGISNFLEEICSFSYSIVFPLFVRSDHWGKLSYLSLLFFGPLHSDGYIFPFLLCLSLLFPQLFVRPPQTTILLFCISSWEWFWSLPMGFPDSSVSKESTCSAGESESCSVASNSLRPHGILQARILEWVAFPFSRGSSQPRSPTLQTDSLPAEPQGKPKNTEVGSLSLLQQIFPTQVSCIAGGFFTSWATREAQEYWS